MAHVSPNQRRDFRGRADWGATKVRMVSRMDKVVNWARRGRKTRESHAHHHGKSYRMEH